MMMALFGKLFPGLAKPSSRRDELTELLQESIEDKTSFDSHEGALLRNLLGLRDKTAIDVMIPRADIVSVALTDSLDDIVKQMSVANHSRVPVHRDTLDDVAGIIHIKDLVTHLRNGKTPAVQSLLRPALFVSPTIRLLDLLNEMRLRRRHLALVVDEFGGVDGLITIEDLVEEIVGEIEDEHDDAPKELINEVREGVWECDARAELDDVAKIIDPRLEEVEEAVDTLGGLTFVLAEQVPPVGTTVEHPSGWRIEVTEGDETHVKRLRLHSPKVKKRQQSRAV